MACCRFPAGARLLDVGCGTGATVRHLRERHGMEAFGLDAEPGCAGAQWLLRAKAERLPLAAASMDGVLLECSLSVVTDPGLALEECHRVLKPGGRLVLSDLYARGVPARLRGCLGRVEAREALEAQIEQHGFKVALFEDHSEALRALWGQLVFDRGLQAFCAELGAAPGALRAVRCGYCLILARREGP
jgi:ubiquinone/menaquinone biosynthesis C-methylase UbiE